MSWAIGGAVILAIFGAMYGVSLRLKGKATREEVEGEQAEATIRWHERVGRGLAAPLRTPAEWAARMREARLRRRAAAEAGAEREGDDSDA